MTEGPQAHAFGINSDIKALLEPVCDGGEKLVVFPAAIAKHAVMNALLQRVGYAGGGGEIMHRDGEGQQIGRAKTVGDIVPQAHQVPCRSTTVEKSNML